MNYVAAKNLVLAGVKSVTIYDPEPVRIQDLSSQVRVLRTCNIYICLTVHSYAVLSEAG